MQVSMKLGNKRVFQGPKQKLLAARRLCQTSNHSPRWRSPLAYPPPPSRIASYVIYLMNLSSLYIKNYSAKWFNRGGQWRPY